MASLSQVKNIAYRMSYEDAGFAAGMNSAATAAKAAGVAGEQAAAGVKTVTAEVKGAIQPWSTLSQRIDANAKVAAGTEKANRELAKALVALNVEALKNAEVAKNAAAYEATLTAQRDAAIAKVKQQAAAQALLYSGSTAGATGFVAANNNAVTSSGRFGQVMGQAGYQVQDFAVQVQMGTSALTALGQQGSQLLGVFGTGGAIAGAILTVGILAVKLLDLAGSAKTLDEALEENAASYTRVTTAAKDRVDQIKNEAEAVESLRAGYVAMGAASAAAEAVILQRNRNQLATQDFNLTQSLGGNLAGRIEASSGRQPAYDALGNATGGFTEGTAAAATLTSGIGAAVEAFKALREAGQLSTDGVRAYIAALDDAAKSGGINAREIYGLRDAAIAALPKISELETAYRQNAVQAAALRLASGESAEAIIASSQAATASAGGYGRLTAEIVRTAQALNALRNRAIDDPMADINAETARLTQQLQALNTGGTAAFTSVKTAQEAQIDATARATQMQEKFVKALMEQRVPEEEAIARGQEMAASFVAAASRRAEAARTVGITEEAVRKAEQEGARAATAAASAARSAASKGATEARREAADVQRDSNTLMSNMDKFWGDADKAAEKRQEASGKAVESLEQQLALVQAEAGLLGENAATRDRELAQLREKNRLGRGEEVTPTGESRIKLAGEIADATTAITRQKSAFAELQNIGEQAFERIGSALTSAFTTGKITAIDFGNIAKAVLSELVQRVLKLAVLNPILNTLFGKGATTAGDVVGVAGGGGIVSKLFGGGVTAGVGSIASSGAQAATGAAGSGSGGLGISDYSSIAGIGQKAYGLFSGGGSSITGTINAYGAQTGLFSNAGAAQFQPLAAGVQGPVAGAADIAGGATGITAGTAATGALGIAGGAYGIYSGLERGGVGGYTTAAGGAIGVAAGGATLLATAAPALAALGPYGLIAAAVIMAIGALLPGAAPSNRTGSAAVDLASGAVDVYGQTGDKFSQGNRDAASGLISSVQKISEGITAMTGAAPQGRIVADVGNRDGIGFRSILPNGVDSGTMKFGNDEAGQAEFMRAATVKMLESINTGALPQALSQAIGGMLKTSAEQIMTDLAKLADATNGGKPSANQNIAAANIDFSNTDAAVADLKWVRDVYEPLQKAAEAANQYQVQLDAITGKWGGLSSQAERLGLATDKLNEARDKEIAALAAQRSAIAEGFDRGLQNREAVVSGSYVADPLAAALEQFDVNAKAEVATAKATLQQWGILAEEQSTRILRLETVLAGERQKLIADTVAAQAAAAQAQAAAAQAQVDAVNAAIAAQMQAIDEATGGATQYAAALAGITKKWADLAATSAKLGLETDSLIAARDREIAALAAQRAATEAASNEGFTNRLVTLANPAAGAAMSLATQQRGEMASLIATLTQAGSTAETIAAQVAKLTQTQYGERAANNFAVAQSAYASALQQQINLAGEQISTQRANTAALAGVGTSLRSWLRSLAVSEQSPLTPAERLAELRSQFSAATMKAGDSTLSGQDRAAAAQEAQGLGQQLLSEAASYYGKATAAYGAEYASVSGKVSSLASAFDVSAKAEAEKLKLAEGQLDTQKKQLEETQRLGEAQLGSLDALRETMELAFASFLQTRAAAGAATGTPVTPVTGTPTDITKSADYRAGLYLIANPDVAQAIASGDTFGSGNRATAAYAHYEKFGKAEGRKYAAGGWISNGEWNRDSVTAQLAGGGNVALAGGEYVMNAKSAAIYSDVLPAMNRGNYGGANDNSAAVEMRAMRAELASLKAVIAQGALATVAAVERGNGLAADGATDRKLSLAR